MHLQTVTTATAAEVDAQVDGQVEPKPEPRERRGSHLFSGGLGLRAGSKRWDKPRRPWGTELLLLWRHAAFNDCGWQLLSVCGTSSSLWPLCPATLQAWVR